VSTPNPRQPTQPTPPEPTRRPERGQPWPDPYPASPREPRHHGGPCCDLAAGGDWCTCADDQAELAAAFAPRDLTRGRPGPILLDLRQVA
jgi:hypothetical protein